MTDSPEPASHGDRVPGAAEFEADRASWRRSLGADEALRHAAINLQLAADVHHYTYTWSWLGIPVIRLPDDICVLQELVWNYRPQVIIETGVARGGSMVLDASLQKLCGVEPRVLGVDIQILPHTRDALADHPLREGITLLEADSTTEEVRVSAGEFLGSAERALLILDSNHTHAHVLGELRSLATLIPAGGYVLVADTLIEELPKGYFTDRPWNRGDNPLTALRQFLAENPSFELDDTWSRRGLLSEFRDGIARRTR